MEPKEVCVGVQVCGIWENEEDVSFREYNSRSSVLPGWNSWRWGLGTQWEEPALDGRQFFLVASASTVKLKIESSAESEEVWE